MSRVDPCRATEMAARKAASHTRPEARHHHGVGWTSKARPIPPAWFRQRRSQRIKAGPRLRISRRNQFPPIAFWERWFGWSRTTTTARRTI